jgi:CRP/FNR family transcriptional regulator
VTIPDFPDEDVDFLSLLGDSNRRRILDGSTQTDYRAGTVAFRPDGPPSVFVIEHGLARGYSSLPDGRQATIGFIHEKELVGALTIVSRPLRVFVQIVADSTVTCLDLETARKLAAGEVEVSAALAVRLAAYARNAARLIAVRSLGNIRERLAYDLLERACRSQLAVGRLEVKATQSDLADSIGSAREVISRALSALRAEGIVETAPGTIRVILPMRLADIVRAFAI